MKQIAYPGTLQVRCILVHYVSCYIQPHTVLGEQYQVPYQANVRVKLAVEAMKAKFGGKSGISDACYVSGG